MLLKDFLDSRHCPSPIISKRRTTRQTSIPANPRVLRNHLQHWTTLQQDVNMLLEQYLNTNFVALNEEPQVRSERLYGFRPVHSEREISRLAEDTYEEATQEILKEVFHVRTKFVDHRSALNIGNPDRVFILQGEYDSREQEPDDFVRMVVEYKSPWALEIEDLINTYNSNKNNLGHKIVKAVNQLNGYMTFNNLRYGVLSNYKSTYFFQRTPGSLETLQVSSEYMYSTTGISSTIATYVYVCHEVCNVRWFHFSPTRNPAPKPVHLMFDKGFRVLQPLENISNPPIDWSRFELVFTDILAKNNASVIRGSLRIPGVSYNRGVIFKIYDLSSERMEDMADAETNIYQSLASLQGTSIPRLYCVGDIWSMLRVLVLEDVGEQLLSSAYPGFQAEAKKCLGEVHRLGYIHGDLAYRNFAWKPRYGLRLIDFNEARPGTIQETEAEIEQLEDLE